MIKSIFKEKINKTKFILADLPVIYSHKPISDISNEKLCCKDNF